MDNLLEYPVPLALNQSLHHWHSEQRACGNKELRVDLLIGRRLEAVDYQLDGEVLVAIVLTLGVSVLHHQGPLVHIYHLVSQVREFEVAVVLSEIVQALLREHCLHLGVAVAYKDARDVVDHDKFEGNVELDGECQDFHCGAGHVGLGLGEVVEEAGVKFHHLGLHAALLVQEEVDDVLQLWAVKAFYAHSKLLKI